jgi:hypothetical protein
MIKERALISMPGTDIIYFFQVEKYRNIVFVVQIKEQAAI